MHSILKIFAHSDLMVHVHKNVIKFLKLLDTLFYARVKKSVFIIYIQKISYFSFYCL